MKKLLIFVVTAFLLLALPGCEDPPGSQNSPEPEATETTEAKYIWTISIDGTKSRTYGDGQLTANYTVHLSASMEGGESPLGEYHGEIRVEYEGVPDEATLYAINFLKGSYDFEGWGENDAYSFTMEPYDHTEIIGFVRDAYQGAGARLAPLLQGTGMYLAEDILWTDSDWEMWLSAGLTGIFGIDAQGDETGGSAHIYTPFGNDSASREGSVPLGCSIHFINENRVQFNIWRHGYNDVNLSFTGTLDKVLLSDTIPVK